MQHETFYPIVIVSCIVQVCLAMGLAAESAKAEETEILKITVGEPTLLHCLNYQNAASISGSRTGVVAAFYPWNHLYRTSADGGVKPGGHRWILLPSTAAAAAAGSCGDGGVIKDLHP